jgi:hypothetical protein
MATTQTATAKRTGGKAPAVLGTALNWIDGDWVDAGKRSKSFDPATGEEIGRYADARRDDVSSAIQAEQHRLDDIRRSSRGKGPAEAELLLGKQLLAHNQWTLPHQALSGSRGTAGEDRILFSVDCPYEQMSSAALWFDDAQFSNALKLKVGRENANKLLGLGLKTVSTAVAAGFAA